MLPWLYLLFAAIALAIAFKTSSIAVAVLCLIGALVLTGAWLLGLLAQRIGSRSRDEQMMIDPQELRRLREQAEARRAAASSDEPRT